LSIFLKLNEALEVLGVLSISIKLPPHSFLLYIFSSDSSLFVLGQKILMIDFFISSSLDNSGLVIALSSLSFSPPSFKSIPA
jgi:hypothetical protein